MFPWSSIAYRFIVANYINQRCVLGLTTRLCINPGSQIPQVEARKRCSCDLFTSSGRATALIDRHFWYTFLQQSMTRLTNTAILLTYTSRFHWRFSGNRQEHICERNIIVWEPWSMTQNYRLKFFLCWLFIYGLPIVISRGVWRSHPWAIWEIQDGRQYGRQHLGDL